MLEEYKNIQPVAYKILSNSIASGKYSHAYLFETNGYENGLDMAICFAKNILGIQDLNIDEQNYPELKIISPDGMWIKKEQLIDLQNEFSKKSIIGNKKVYIINQAEKLNVNSSNTILKFIEEPPEGIVAILVTENIYQLLETIVSRCQVISLNGQVNVLLADKTITKIARLISNTSLEYENFISEDNETKIKNIVKFINYYESNKRKTLLHINELWFEYFQDKSQVYDAIYITLLFYKDCLNRKIGCEIEVFTDYLEDVDFVVDKNNLDDLIRKIKVINDNRYYINNNANLNLLMDKIIIEMEEGV